MKLLKSILLFCFFSSICSGQVELTFHEVPGVKYEITKQKIIGFSFSAFGGLFDGIAEGFQFDDRKSFERKWGVDPYGYWGSKSWQKRYTNPNFYNKNFGVWDAYHNLDDLRKIGYIGGAITLSLGGKNCGQKFKHYLYDFLISFAVSGITKRIGLSWVRK